jgi:hypothetical protein
MFLNFDYDLKLGFYLNLNGNHDNICFVILYLGPITWVAFKVHKNLLFFQNQNIHLANFLSMLSKQTYSFDKFHVVGFLITRNPVGGNYKSSGWKPKI